MKKCTKCLRCKEIEDFYYFKSRGIYDSRCKDCAKSQVKEYSKSNPIKAYKSKIAAEKKKPDIYNSHKRLYKLRNKEKIRRYNKNYRKKNAEKLREKNSDYWRNNPERSWCLKTLNAHRNRGYKVDLTTKDLLMVAKETKECCICGVELRWQYGEANKKPAMNSPSLDRVNNSIFIDKDNFQIICMQCNITKNSRNMEEFISYCRMIVDKFDTKK